jgi:protein SCO1/2
MRFGARLQRLAGRPSFWFLCIAAGLAFPIVNQVRRAVTPPLPELGTLPAFALTDQDGRPFGSADLEGKVWMAGFIFTRCPTICPAVTKTMTKIQDQARGIDQTFRLVSFSVDPTYDTAERLQEYARRFRVSPGIWKLLTGSLDGVRDTVTGGLKIAMGEPVGETDFASVFHGTHFVLVDQKSRIRGYYDSSDPDVADRVLRDAAMLINRGD